MEIPKSLQSVWTEAIKDNKVTKEEYSKLLSAASPNKKNEEFDNEEIEFLSTVKQEIDKKGFNVGNIPDQFKSQSPTKPSKTPNAEPISFVESEDSPAASTNSTEATEKPEKDSLPSVPDSIKQKWNELSKDGEIDKKDYQQLLTAAAPNSSSKELTKSEYTFLKALRGKIEEGSGVYKTSTPESIELKTEKSDKFNPGKVPDTLKETWKKVSADGKISKDDYNQLINATAPTGKDDEIDENEAGFLMKLKEQLMKSTGSIDIETNLSTQDVAPPEKEKPSTNTEAKNLIDKYSSSFIPNPANAAKREQTEKEIANDISKLDSKDLVKLRKQLSEIPDTEAIGGGTNGAKASLLKAVNNELGKRNPEKAVPTAQSMINKYSDAFQYLMPNQANEDKAKTKMKSEISSLSDKDLMNLKNQMPSASYSKSHAGVKSALSEIIDGEIAKRENIKPAKADNKVVTPSPAPVNNARSDNATPASLKEIWNQVSSDKVINADDLNTLIKAAMPNGKPEELDEEERKFLADLTKKLIDNNASLKI